MKLLLDTHTVLWWLEGYSLIADLHNQVLISPIVPWEIALKVNKHRQIPHRLVTDFHSVIKTEGFTAIGIDPLHAIRSGLLQFHHRDPFDRLLVAQSLEMNVPLVSKDAAFDRYGVERIW